MKTKQERFTREIEESLDKEFAGIGITTLHTCHLRPTCKPPSFMPGTPCAITIVSEHAIDSDVVERLSQDIASDWMCTQQVGYLSKYMLPLMVNHGFPGISICSCGDDFNCCEGQIRAKRHLLSHLINTVQTMRVTQ